MARKTLLTEGEIRQFMKLAKLTPLGASRLQLRKWARWQVRRRTANKGHGPGKEVKDGNGHGHRSLAQRARRRRDWKWTWAAKKHLWTTWAAEDARNGHGCRR